MAANNTPPEIHPIVGRWYNLEHGFYRVDAVRREDGRMSVSGADWRRSASRPCGFDGCFVGYPTHYFTEERVMPAAFHPRAMTSADEIAFQGREKFKRDMADMQKRAEHLGLRLTWSIEAAPDAEVLAMYGAEVAK